MPCVILNAISFIMVYILKVSWIQWRLYYHYELVFTLYFFADYKYKSWRLTSLSDLFVRWFSYTSYLWYLLKPPIQWFVMLWDLVHDIFGWVQEVGSTLRPKSGSVFLDFQVWVWLISKFEALRHGIMKKVTKVKGSS